ncbi:hypothetical protein [Pseudoduganella violacea]|uniref:Lipocalin-like domain-containing protein n=1 Tax=Pseudoduganella violacea TaxID=1715466 RepID=A0A7W5BF49_9BURK|nr:hypothetical protein [Pseudoduganella violacea]MBB3122004.1 hypothetical protein [Pseudoduganella violacea]
MKPTLFFSALLLSLAAHAQQADHKLVGIWKITAVLDSQDTTSLSSEDATKLVGKTLLIESQHVHFDDADCKNASFKMARHRFYSYFVKQYNFEPKHLPLPDYVQEVAIECASPVGINFIYLRDRNQIVLFWEGFFLNATRQK